MLGRSSSGSVPAPAWARDASTGPGSSGQDSPTVSIPAGTLTADEVRAVRRIAASLVRGELDELVSAGEIFRGTSADVARTIGDYGGTLVASPPQQMEHAFVTPFGGLPGSLLVDLPLWTEEEGRSDLILQCLVRRDRAQPPVGLWSIGVI